MAYAARSQRTGLPGNDSGCVAVTVELGHSARASPERGTYNWTVFVRGYQGIPLECLVKKVVFNINETAKKSKRVVSEPPFEVSECGCAGFIMEIEIHLKNRQGPRRITLRYDLFLNSSQQPVYHVRQEILKFQNPGPEFREKLLQAGGVEYAKDTSKLNNKRNHSKPPSKKKIKKKKMQGSPLSSLSPSSEDEKESPPLQKSQKPSSGGSPLSSLSPSSEEEEENPPLHIRAQWLNDL